MTYKFESLLRTKWRPILNQIIDDLVGHSPLIRFAAEEALRRYFKRDPMMIHTLVHPQGSGQTANWSRVERIIARGEVGAEGPDTRFVVTNLKLFNARVPF